MSDQQEQNQIAASTAEPSEHSASASVENTVVAKVEKAESPVEKAPAKPKRARRTTKKAVAEHVESNVETKAGSEREADSEAKSEAESEAKPRTRRSPRTKVEAEPSSVPVSDEVAQARALAQISQAQVVRAQRKAAEREAAVLSELVSEAERSATSKDAGSEDGAGSPAVSERPARTRRRTVKKAVAETVETAVASDEQKTDADAPIVDPALRPHRRGRKPKAYVEAEKAAAAALAAQHAAEADSSPVSDSSDASDAAETKDASHEDVRPGRGRRAASKRSVKRDASDSSEPQAPESADSEISSDQPEKPKRTRRKKKSDHSADDASQAPANDEAAPSQDQNQDKGEKPDKADKSDKDKLPKSEDGGHQNRRQHKRDRSDERGDHRDDRNDRRQRQRDRKQRNKDRYNTPTEPTLSREELAAMKVAELREKAKEFEIETTGKKKAELVEEIYTTAAKLEGFRDIKGILEIANEGYGHIHAHGYMPSRDDAFVPANMIRAARLRSGDVIEGTLRPSRANDKFPGLSKIKTINGLDPEEARKRPKFSDLTPIYPNEPLRMEHGKDSITGRAIDIVSPIGKGQRGLIVSPPKAGKTTILKKICQSISINNPEVHLICLLVDERPEEVTDMQRSIKGEVVASTFDMPADNHTRVSELVIERAKRIVELGGDVVVVLDSITRLARAYNLAAPASGRILSGGVDSAALYPPKRFLGAARNIENGGSLTILASALVDTGSKMDEVIFEEFKGTGNMELKLDRDLADRRIFPAIDPVASGTRNEDLLVDEQMRPFVFGLRRILAGMNNTERAAASFIKGLKGTDNNQEFLVRTAKKANEHEAQY